MEEASYTDPDKTRCEESLTQDKGRRFVKLRRRAGVQNAHDVLTGTATLRSYMDPDKHC